MARLTLIVPSKGRPSLKETVSSAVGQMLPGDELLVDVNGDPWGNRARHRQMMRAKGDLILFNDDDDVYVPGALDVVRAAYEEAPGRVHIFRMKYADGRVIWTTPELKPGNVASQIVAVPNRKELLGSWLSDRYTADFGFIHQTVTRTGEPAWHEDVIVEVGLAADVHRPLEGEPGW